ncbi:cache domain-containing protein [Massilia sp. W12]|uniref:cache domain-containing protein n=1 Tax=Massilia sp. W12 TaxID=3126507 RepID=UPI0030CE02BE
MSFPFTAWRLYCIALLFSCMLPHASAQAVRSTPEQAKAMVKRAISYYREHGKEKAFARFNDPQGAFVKGDLYLFAFHLKGDGIQLVHGNNPKMLGKNVLDMRDADGKLIIRAFIELANSPQGAGWVDYKWPHPLTKAQEIKTSYIERVDDIFIGCGAYKATQSGTP